MQHFAKRNSPSAKQPWVHRHRRYHPSFVVRASVPQKVDVAI
jgi:hypothetical protein